MSQKVDLHLHSYASDGQWSPEELLENIDKNDIKIFAVTDHDDMTCVPFMSDLVKDRPDLRFIKGVEGTVTYNGKELHILTYDVDETNRHLQEILAYNRQIRMAWDYDLMTWLGQQYPTISAEDFRAYDYNPYQGGWRAYGYLKDKGVIEDLQTYFDCVKGFERLKVFMSPENYLPKMKALGYKTVLAHPPAYTQDDFYDEVHLDYLRNLGLSGIECYSQYLTHQTNSQYYVDYCHKHNMIITGGSDCHGGFVGRAIGYPDVDASMVRLWQ